MKKNKLTLSKRKEIQKLQDDLISMADGVNIEGDGQTILHSVNFPLKHTFADGIYVRQMDMKAGSAVVGAIHNHLHVWFLLTGHLIIATEDFKEEYIAPCYEKSMKGAKRLILSLEDSLFINVHKNPTNTRDMKEVEESLYSITIEEYNKKEKLWQE